MSHIYRLLLILAVSSLSPAAFSQTLYELKYHYVDNGVNDNYRAFLTRHNDGTGFIRVAYFDSSANSRQLYELPMEEIYGEHEDGSPDSSQLIFYAHAPRTIFGVEGDYVPDHFVFEMKPGTSYYEPAFVYTVNEDSTQEFGIMDDVRLLEQADLSEELVLHYFTPQDDFYVQLFATTTRGLTAQEKKTTLHLVLVANTEDKSIGTTCAVDKDATFKTFSEVAEFLGIQFSPTVISGKEFSKVNVDKAVSAVQPGSDDIVVFYYSGHGFNDVNEGYQFPYMDLRDKSFQKYGGAYALNVETIFQKLKAKGGRLNLVLSDCCNNDPTAGQIMSGVGASTRTSSIGWSMENCQALFMDKKRTSLLMTAAVKGQLSAGNPADGGLFTFSFRESLEKALGPFTRKPNWNTLIADAKTQTITKASHTWCDKVKRIICAQNPVFKVE